LQYRREIDGLRALAVVPVILFHAHVPYLPGGFIGVDIFFVISGFLITSLLAEDLATDRFSLVTFYERRARRILPALFFVMLITLPPAFALMLPSQLEDYAASLAAVVVFLSNFFFLSQVGYFAPDAELQPLLHTWSLGVEEQFYLLFPPLLAILWHRLRRYTLAVLCLIAMASFLICIWGASENPARNFYFTGSRAWELMAGAVAALVVRRTRIRGNSGLAALGFGLILGAFFLWTPGTPAPGAWMLIPVVGTVLILVFAQKGTTTERFLSYPGFVSIGLVSYSAYLWHQPLFAFARLYFVAEPPAPIMAALTVLTFLLAWMTWAMIERPFRRKSARILANQRSLFLVAGLTGGILFAVGVFGKATDGFNSLWQKTWPERAAIMQLVRAAQLSTAVQDDGECRFNIENVDPTLANRIVACYDQYGKGIAVLGDSHAIDLFGIVTARQEHAFVVGFTKPACRPTTQDRECPYASFDAFVTANPSVFKIALFEMSGAYLLQDASGNVGVQEAIESLPLDAKAPELGLALDEIDAVDTALSELARKVPLVWIGPRIEPQVQLTWLVNLGCDSGLTVRAGTVENYQMLDTYLARTSSVPYLNQNSLFRLKFPDDLGGCGGLYWKDGDHLSLLGMTELAGRTDPVGAALARLR
jgi:peptidoglycan/LPS O-acetylase OafA/YrhL